MEVIINIWTGPCDLYIMGMCNCALWIVCCPSIVYYCQYLITLFQIFDNYVYTVSGQSAWGIVFLGSADASTDPKIRVGGCIHRLYFLGRWMHPPTLVLGRWMHPPTQKLESVDASTDSINWVGGCIHRPKKGLLMPTVHWLKTKKNIFGLIRPNPYPNKKIIESKSKSKSKSNPFYIHRSGKNKWMLFLVFYSNMI